MKYNICKICGKKKLANIKNFFHIRKKLKNTCKVCELEELRKWKLRLKKKVFEAYGGKCVCCGEKEFEFLTLDHFKGNGRKHRKSLNIADGFSLYRWLYINDFPKEDIRILCYNCNCSTKDGKICVHKRKSKYKNIIAKIKKTKYHNRIYI